MKHLALRSLVKILGLVSMLAFTQVALAYDPPASFTYQGRVYLDNGIDPLESSSVTFKVQILSPDGGCLLYEESHARDMSGSGGNFALIVGEGLSTGAALLSIPQVFDNSTVKVGAASCTYNPNSGDNRKIRLSYLDSGLQVTLATDQSIRSVPYAINAMSLEGLSKNQLIQISAQTTQLRLDTLLTNYNDLVLLAAGPSPLNAKASDLPMSGGLLNLSSGGVKVPDAPSAPTSAVNKNYSDANLGGRAIDLTGISNGQSLIWNSSLGKWQTTTAAAGTVTSVVAGTGLAGGTITSSGTIALATAGTAGTYSKVTTDAYGRVTSGASLASSDIATALGYTSVNKAGDTFGGDVSMASHNLTNVGYLSMSSSRYLGLGSFDATAEGNLVTNTLTPGGVAYAGAFWYNSATKALKYWDGTQVVTATSSSAGAIQSLNSQSGLAQTLAIGSAGTSPAWSSASNAHTLNLPMASTATVTAGLLSNADYATFNAKQASLGFTPLDRAGSNSMAANLSLSPDGGTTTYKITNLKDPSSVQDAGTKNYTDSNVAGFRQTIGSLNNSTDVGKMLVWSGTTSGWTVGTGNAGTVTSVSVSAPLAASTASTTPALSLQSGTAAGQSLVWSGTAWAVGALNVSQLKGVASASQFPTNCTAAQTLTYQVVTDTYVCTTIAISASQVSGLGSTASLSVGTAANAVVQLDANAKLPAVDGSQLTNLPLPPFSNMNVVTSSGATTWTVPAGISKVYVQVWGGGGGGAGGYGAAFVAVTAGASITVNVGVGGSGGGTGAAGTVGGNSSFVATSATISASGGAGGNNAATGPSAGGTSSAAINIAGGAGSAASPLSVISLGGMGGSAGGGGGPGGGSGNAATAGGAGSAPGGGGRGGGNGTLTGGATGGAGGVGRVIVWW